MFSRVNGDGERIYKRGMLGVARGNGKTPLAAGLALRELLGASDEPDVILAAAARDQARVCFEYSDEELAQFRSLLKRYCELELDNWEMMRTETPTGPLYIILSAALLPETTPEMYQPI